MYFCVTEIREVGPYRTTISGTFRRQEIAHTTALWDVGGWSRRLAFYALCEELGFDRLKRWAEQHTCPFNNP